MSYRNRKSDIATSLVENKKRKRRRMESLVH